MFKVNEVFVTVQGEGQYVGTPSLFIRTTGCNLRCSWKNQDGSITVCDTPYSSFNPESGWELNLAKEIQNLKIKYPKVKHVVVTGGEPTIQSDFYKIVQALLRFGYRVTVETNGTRLPKETYHTKIFYSISPKLGNSYYQQNKFDKLIHGSGNTTREVSCSMLVANQKPENYQFKFVVSNKEDLLEIKEFVKKVKIPTNRVWLMPQGITSQQLKKVEKWLIEICIKEGFNYSPRMHIDIWGKKRGV